MIILEKARKEEMLSLEGIVDMTASAEIAQVSSPIYLIRSYNWAISNTNLDAIKKLRLTNIEKY